MALADVVRELSNIDRETERVDSLDWQNLSLARKRLIEELALALGTTEANLDAQFKAMAR